MKMYKNLIAGYYQELIVFVTNALLTVPKGKVWLLGPCSNVKMLHVTLYRGIPDLLPLFFAKFYEVRGDIAISSRMTP